MKIIETLQELRQEIPKLNQEQLKLDLLETLIECRPLRARISEAQCVHNQERCRFFNENKQDYFVPWRISGNIKKPKEFKAVRWGMMGESVYYSPQDLACLECKRYQK